MPNCSEKKCAISLQSFAKDCMACNGAISFSAPGSVDLPARCTGSGIAQKRQKNAEGLGRRSAFFLGGAAIILVPPAPAGFAARCPEVFFGLVQD